jgi:RNA-binding protein 26
MNPIQMMSMLQGGFPLPWMMGAPNGGTYNPNDAQMDMSTPFPNGRGEPTKPYQPADAVNLTPTLVRPQSTSYPDPNIVQPTLEIAGDYTSPSQPSPGEDFTHRGRGRGRSGQQRGRGQGYSQRGTFPNADQQLSFPDPSEPTPVTAESSSTYPSKRPGRNDSKTIVVERIPAESLSLSAISAYFSKFGTVTNVAIDAPTSKALISFSTHEEAHAAWNNQEAVFGNRFVKVFWHRPMGGHGGEGARKLAASAPLVQNLMTSTDSAKPPLTPLSSTPDGIPSTSATRPGSVSVMGPVAPAVTPAASIAARKALLEKQIGEQKALFASLESASSPEKKKEIMGKLRVIAEEMKKDPLLPATSALSNKRTSMGVGAANASALDEQRQQRAREKLDRELEIHASKGIPGASESAGSANGGDTNRQSQLLAELAALRKQVCYCAITAKTRSTPHNFRP